MTVEGAELNIRDAYGQTPLHVTVLEGDFETVRLLLPLGADQSILDEDCRCSYDIEFIASEM